MANINWSMRHHQFEVLSALERFNVLLAHRRFGKTVFAVIWLVQEALKCKHPRPQVHYFAPNYTQAKKVAWMYVKQYTRDIPGTVYNESELKATLPTQAIIQLGGAQDYDTHRGIYTDACVLDEPSIMAYPIFTEVLRPAMSDRLGKMLMIGTPNGRHGLFFDSYEKANDLPDWKRFQYKASDTGIIVASELDAMRSEMSRAEYEQEMECSFSAAIKGAYYGEVMNDLEADNAFTTIRHDKARLVHACFDLGMNDATAIWYFQIAGNEVQFLLYEEFTNTGLPDIIAHMRKKPYSYGAMGFPHDVGVHSLSTGMTRRATLEGLGVEVLTSPRMPLVDGIDITRTFLARCVWDATACRDGIEALRQYKSEWDERKGVLRLVPVHNFASHGADAMRTLSTIDLSLFEDDGWGALPYARTGRH